MICNFISPSICRSSRFFQVQVRFRIALRRHLTNARHVDSFQTPAQFYLFLPLNTSIFFSDHALTQAFNVLTYWAKYLPSLHIPYFAMGCFLSPPFWQLSNNFQITPRIPVHFLASLLLLQQMGECHPAVYVKSAE